MSDQRKFVRIFFVLLVFGIVVLLNMVNQGRLGAIRPVDILQMIGIGMCFGGALVSLVAYLQRDRTT